MDLLASKVKRLLPTEEKHKKCKMEMDFLMLRREERKAKIARHLVRIDDGLVITVKLN